MECKLSKENAILEQALAAEKMRSDDFNKMYRRQEELHREWCDKLEKVIEDLGYPGGNPNVDAALRRALTELVELREKTGLKPGVLKGMCPGYHCKRYIGSDYNFCPRCGRAVGTKVAITVLDIFEKIEKELPIIPNLGEKRIINQWSCRWAWAKRRLIDGEDNPK